MNINVRRTLVVAATLSAIGGTASAQARVEKNVVYGMYSGAAMLLDVHYPAKANGFGIIFIPAAVGTPHSGIRRRRSRNHRRWTCMSPRSCRPATRCLP